MKIRNHLILLSIIGTQVVHASDEARMRNIENRLSAIEASEAPCVINPSARPYPANCWGLYVQIDPLVWQARTGGLAPAIEASSTSFFGNEDKSKVKNLKPDWDWGFRVALGVNTTHDAWDIMAQWTHYNTDSSTSCTVSDGEALFPVFGHPIQIDTGLAIKMDGKWDLNMNLLDVVLGRDFFVSPCLSLKPFAGLRTAWIKQEYDLKYDELVFDPVQPFATQKIDQEVRYWGLGIRGGLDTQWSLSPCWSIFANYATNLLYNYYKVEHCEEFITNDGDVSPLFGTKSFYHLGSSITDMQLGLRFNWSSCDQCYHIGVDLGWENHFFPGQVQFMKFVDNGMPGKFVDNLGDLATQGFFANVRFDF